MMAAHRRQFPRDMFTGTTIERVTRTAGRPVLMASSDTTARWRKIFIATDMSETSDHAARTAHALGLLEGADVTFNHGYAPITRQMMTHAGIPTERVDRPGAPDRPALQPRLGRGWLSRGAAQCPWLNHAAMRGAAAPGSEGCSCEIRERHRDTRGNARPPWGHRSCSRIGEIWSRGHAHRSHGFRISRASGPSVWRRGCCRSVSRLR